MAAQSGPAPPGLGTIRHRLSWTVFQTQYRQEREELAQSLFSAMPDTLQSSFAREMAETHSQVGGAKARLLIGPLLLKDAFEFESSRLFV